MIFLTAVESVLSIVLIIALGFYLRNKGWFADSFAGNISKLIMNIALPASIFVSVLTYLTRDKLMALSDSLIYGALSIVFGYFIAWLMVKVLKVRRGRRGVFINTIVNANTIFIGLPLNIALFGEASMPYFLVYYVLNTVSTWAFGAFLIANDSTEPQPAHRTSTRGRPGIERSSMYSTRSPASGSKNDGHPQCESNFDSLRNSSAPQARQE